MLKHLLVDGAIDSGILHTCYEEDSDGSSRGGLDEGSCASSIPRSVEIDLVQEYTIDGMLIVNRLDEWRLNRAEGLMVDFMDADRNVKLTTAPITNAHMMDDGFIMDVQAGIQRNGEGEFDAWSYAPFADGEAREAIGVAHGVLGVDARRAAIRFVYRSLTRSVGEHPLVDTPASTGKPAISRQARATCPAPRGICVRRGIRINVIAVAYPNHDFVHEVAIHEVATPTVDLYDRH